MPAAGGLVKSNASLRDLVKMLGGDQKIVTPRLTRFLLDHEDGVEYEPEVIEKVIELLTARKRERIGTFSASSAGDCPRAQVLAFLGTPKRRRTDVKMQNMGNDGTWRHARYQANLLQAGIIDDVEFPLPWARMRSMGTMDGVGTVPVTHPLERWRGIQFGLELKGAFSFKAVRIETEGPETYLAQVKRYMLVSGLPLVVILVENRDSLEWAEYVYEATPEMLAESRAGLEALNRAVDTKTLPPRLHDCELKTGQTFRNCPFGGATGHCAMLNTWPKKRPATVTPIR